ncbi:MAG TPA: single-stranded DNA-binding protein, partial [Clostridia bacterium]|nr:single-stranded DNA-binding protein [Clostridia bacterium]
TGNLTRDPVVNNANGDKVVCNFTLAVNRKNKSADGTRPADFFDVAVWGKRGQTLANMLKKGMRVFVRGELQAYSYTGKNGVKHEKHRIVLDDDLDALEFLSAKPKGAIPEDSAEDETGGEE